MTRETNKPRRSVLLASHAPGQPKTGGYIVVCPRLSINARALTREQQAFLEALGEFHGLTLPKVRYWYDRRAGLFGFWGGPTLAILPPHLDLPGPMPPHCSSGGSGIFANRRELHPLDVAVLTEIALVIPGHYWLDPNGDFGFEGGPLLANLFTLARAEERLRLHARPRDYRDPRPLSRQGGV